MSDEGVELSDVIRQVRGDLERAIWAGEGKHLGFRLGDVELQLEVSIARVTKPGATIKLMVLDAEAKQERSRTSRHHVKVTLHPQLRDSPDETPWVSSLAVEGEE
jgi:hypothetical protein